MYEDKKYCNRSSIGTCVSPIYDNVWYTKLCAILVKLFEGYGR